MGKDGRVRLCDFGFARQSDGGVRSAMTICGTPGFVAPEIMCGAEYDEQCDVFSYGNVLAELLTHLRPGKDFWIRTAEDQFALDLGELEEKVKGRGVPPDLLELTLQCCAYDPSNRPSFVDILKRLQVIAIPQEEVKVPPRETARDSTAPQTLPPVDPQTEGEVWPVTPPPLEGPGWKQVEKMVARAVSPELFDSEYLQDLLLTYPCFTDPPTLFTVLLRRFEVMLTEEPRKDQRVGVMRVIVFLNTWIERYSQDFLMAGMAPLMETFDRLAHTAALESSQPSQLSQGSHVSQDPLSVYSVRATLQRATARRRDSMRQMPQPVAAPLRVGAVLPLTARDLGRQITWSLSQLFAKIEPRGYLKEGWRIPDSPIHRFRSRCFTLQRWAAAVVLGGSSVEERSLLVGKVLETAQQCLNLHNFAAFFALLLALRHPAVERLTLTWKTVKGATLSMFKSFQQLADKTDHYKQYRQKLEASASPAIPYLEVHLEEVAFMDSFTPDTGNGIINFSKHRKIARFIRTMDQYRNPYLDLHPVAAVQEVLNFEVPDDDALMKQSLVCERPANFG